MRGKYILVILIAVIVFSVFRTFSVDEKPHITPFPTITPTTTTASQLANPASENCIKLGGTLTIKTRGDGGQYGLCQFDDNQACEEWALFRGECPKGGIKTTGFDTIEQMYCAWVGGQTLAVTNAQCTLPDKTICSVNDLYNGACPK